MRHRILFYLLLLLASLCPAAKLRLGEALPNFSTWDIRGRPVSSPQLRGRVILLTIQFLNTADEKEVALRRSVIDFYNRYRGRGLAIVRIVSKKNIPFFIPRSYVEQRALVSCSRFGEFFSVVLDWDLSLQRLFGMSDIPLTFLCDRRTQIRYIFNGVLQVNTELEERVRKLLEQNSGDA